ncbi:MAG: Fe-S cluster domain-containing protein [Clostridia bacterium]|nr:Fe-S cluster domain-containing protein [Clostridia bacterium]
MFGNIFWPIIVVGIIGLIAGLGLALASKFMAVKTDEKQEKIRECLPGANCGACGYSGCDGYAEAVANGEAEPNKCAPGGAASAAALAELLGVSVDTTPMVAFVKCGGNREITKTKYGYDGFMSCSAANLLYGGPLSCEYGCIGFGDCYNACPFGAIEMKEGKPVICPDKCVGCSKCVNACPKGVITLVPKGAKVLVKCNNKKKGAPVVKNCNVSCIGCGMCERACPNNAVKVVDNLATIDYNLCTACGKCKEACKRNVII